MSDPSWKTIAEQRQAEIDKLNADSSKKTSMLRDYRRRLHDAETEVKRLTPLEREHRKASIKFARELDEARAEVERLRTKSGKLEHACGTLREDLDEARQELGELRALAEKAVAHYSDWVYVPRWVLGMRQLIDTFINGERQ